MKNKYLMVLVLSVFFVVSGCAGADSEKVVSIDCGDKVGVKVASSMESKEYCVEMADDYTKRGKGLMFRESMPENEGMLFVFDKSEQVSFWMKNTLIPLDLLMFDENMNLLEIKDNFQPCEKAPCESYYSENKVKYVLEVNENQYDESIKEEEIVLTYEKD